VRQIQDVVSFETAIWQAQAPRLCLSPVELADGLVDPETEISGNRFAKPQE
jgi:hypothetical protein